MEYTVFLNQIFILGVLVLIGVLTVRFRVITEPVKEGLAKIIFNITLPLLAPFTLIALTVLSLDIARAYDIVRIMTGGGPAHRTEMIWTYTGRLAIRGSQFGLASAMSMVGVVLGVFFTLYLFRQLIKSRVVY